MKATPLINNFTSGEWSPLLEGRSDLEQYSHSAGIIENALVMPYGGITKLPGTHFVAEVKDSTKKVRLLPFEFNVTQAYMLEFGNEYIRFYMNQGQIVIPDTAIELLCHGDGIDGSKDIIDSSDNEHVISALGDTQIDTQHKYFGTGSIHFFQSPGSYATIPDHACWGWGAGKGCADFWWRPSVWMLVGKTNVFFSQYETDDEYMIFYITQVSPGNYEMHFIIRNGGVNILDLGGAWSPPLIETWMHLAIIRGWNGNPNDWALTAGGKALFTATAAITWVNYAGDLYLGFTEKPGATYKEIAGRMDELCWTKGKTWWEGEFVPPALEYPQSAGGVAYELDSGDGVTYLEADLPYLHFVQEADILYLVHPLYPPKELSRTGHTAWTLTDYIPQKGPLLPVNLDTTSTITPTADSGAGITLTATQDIFNEGHEGNFVWRIKGGYVKIVTYTDSKHVIADVMYDGDLATGPAATDDWAEAAWSAYRGYPGTITLYEQRLCFAASPHKPQSMWLSASGNHELMEIGATDDAALIYTLATREVVKWVFGSTILYAGTTGGVFHISSGDVAYPLTPTNVVVRKHTTFGCSHLLPVKMGNLLYYTQRNNITLREYTYEYNSDAFLAIDATLLAEHMLKPEVIDIAYQQSPYNLLYCVRSDGEVAIFTRNLIQKVMGWARLSDSGTVESVEVISRATGGDEVWFVFKRGDKRFVEYLEQFSFDTLADAFFVRSGLSYSGDPITEIGGLSHLNGEEVAILGDGAVFPRQTVTGGEITIATACSKLHVGLPYEVSLELQKLEAGSALGTAQAKIQRIVQLGIKFYRSLGCSFGIEGKLDTIPFRSANMDMDSPPDLFSGDRLLVFPKGYSRDLKVLVWQDEPLPLTVLSMIAFAETHES